MRVLVLVVVFALFGVSHGTDHTEATKNMVDNKCPSLMGISPLNKALVAKGGYCAFLFAYGLRNPRGIININNNLVVVEKGTQTLSYFNLSTLSEADFSPRTGRIYLYRGHSLNHGVVFDSNLNNLYASSSQTVYRWHLDPETMQMEAGTGRSVITGMSRSGHVTRTLIMNKDGDLLMSIGSGSNLDPNSNRARVMKYEVSKLSSTVKWDEERNHVSVFADGLRNEVGLAMDPRGRIWGVENGVDNLARSDLGGDIHPNNPGEELNLLEEGKFYGYPYCWSEYDLESYNSGWEGQKTRQWAQPEYSYTDEKCRAESVPPKHVSQAHMAPLGMTFKDENTAFVAFHGSWNREPAVGYRVDIYDFTDFNSYHDNKKKREEGEEVDGGVGDENLVKSQPLFAYGKSVPFDRSWIRPVDPVLGPCPYFGECLFFTDDYAGTIIAMGRNPEKGPPFEYPEE